MKCKTVDAQNQRILRINPTTLVIGIDVAKETHVAHAVTDRGIQLEARACSFANTADGFAKFNAWQQRLVKQYRKQDVIVGLEPTGHYGRLLIGYLQRNDLEIAMVNPAATKRNKENRDNSPAKNDAKDALVIAELVSRGIYRTTTPQSEAFERLDRLMKNREHVVGDRISIVNRLHRFLDEHFPEFFRLYKEIDAVRALATLRAGLLPQRVKTLDAEGIIQAWREHGMQRAGGKSGQEAAAKLVAQRAALGAAYGYTPRTRSGVHRRHPRACRRFAQLRERRTVAAASGTQPDGAHVRQVPRAGEDLQTR
jgi:transposase